MLSVIVYSILTLYCSIAYYTNKYVSFLVSLFFILSSFWGLLKPEPVYVYDWMFLITILCTIIEVYKNRKLTISLNDNIGILVFVLVCYAIIAGLLTPFRGVESFAHALMVVRFDIFYFLYFDFKKIPYEDFQKSFKILLKISLINGFIYYLQFFGIYLLFNADDSNLIDGGFSRFSNIPLLTLPIFFYYFVNKDNIKYKYLLLIFWGITIIASQSRGLILGVACSIALYFIQKRAFISKKIIITLSIMLVLGSSVLAYRFSSEGSTGNGLSAEIETIYDFYKTEEYKKLDNSIISTEGTFVFRAVLILERLDYLIEKPLSLLFGAGVYHERYNGASLPFVFGSKTDYGRSKVDTSDIALLSHVFRYGLLYLFLFILFWKSIYKKLKENDEMLSHLVLLFLICISVNAITSDVFHNPQSMVTFLFFLIMCLKSTENLVES